MNTVDRDIEILATRVNSDADKETKKKLNVLRDKLREHNLLFNKQEE